MLAKKYHHQMWLYFSALAQIYGKHWKFRIFRKHWKNYVKLELRKSRKTRSNLKTDSKVRVQVRNAGPYNAYHHFQENESYEVSTALLKRFYVGIICQSHFTDFLQSKLIKLNQKYSFTIYRSGVSNSKLYTGRIEKKIVSAGRILK